jgi:homoserine kinase
MLNEATRIEGHPDNVAPSLFGGCTASMTSGREVHCVPFDVPRATQVGVIIPEYALSTEKARKVLPKRVAHGDAVSNVTRSTVLALALQQGQWDTVFAAMEDTLHEPYRARLMPGFDAVRRAVQKGTLSGVCLSGAGPTILKISNNKLVAEKQSRAIKAILKKAGVTSRVLLPGIDRRGLQVKQIQ